MVHVCDDAGVTYVNGVIHEFDDFINLAVASHLVLAPST